MARVMEPSISGRSISGRQEWTGRNQGGAGREGADHRIFEKVRRKIHPVLGRGGAQLLPPTTNDLLLPPLIITMTTPAPPQILRQYQSLQEESQQLISKIGELEMDRNEHILVEETLAPLDPARRAYRLVGEVLVERTVEQVLPSVQSNRQNLDNAIQTLQSRLDGKQKEAAELKAQYNIPTER